MKLMRCKAQRVKFSPCCTEQGLRSPYNELFWETMIEIDFDIIFRRESQEPLPLALPLPLPPLPPPLLPPLSGFLSLPQSFS
jgi:hypothetical protein